MATSTSTAADSDSLHSQATISPPATKSSAPNGDINHNDGSAKNHTDSIIPTTSPLPPPTPLPSPSTSKTIFPLSHTTPQTHVSLTYSPLSPSDILTFLSSPQAGANILFLGTTRDSTPTTPHESRRVTKLSYTSYPSLAIRTLQRIAGSTLHTHRLERVVIIHRLGEVGVGDSSIGVGVSSGHRGAGWRAAEEVLERVKGGAEIWKREWVEDVDLDVGKGGEEAEVEGEGEQEGRNGNVGEGQGKTIRGFGLWRANKDRDKDGRLR